jgi:hypothetical protein
MKCIKAIKSLKHSEVGDIVRINNVEAEEKVRTGYWEYTAKSEWKGKLNSNIEKTKTGIDNELKNVGVSEKNRELVQTELNSMKKGKNKKNK